MPRRGVVYIVGAGPGDPGLITVRGLELLGRADVILHDRLVTDEILALAHRDARRIAVCTLGSDSATRQSRIHELFVEYAAAGQTVVRLKGGDPFVFGRGFEEVRACRDAGIPCVVVPGVSSVIAGPAAAGIPLTDRNLVRTVAFVTGRISPDAEAPPIDFAALASMDTLVVLMGRENLGAISRTLIKAGKNPATPAACVERATTPEQRVIVSTLVDLPAVADREGLTSPTVIVVGPVAALAEEAKDVCAMFMVEQSSQSPLSP
ncbi:MAG: uroporphyrinogen-III C-methyltransferase [Phycisphaerae bacterium]|nr:uroporphyrinogen-III C-methyltransferase [Phycisphaerae bacterium]